MRCYKNEWFDYFPSTLVSELSCFVVLYLYKVTLCAFAGMGAMPNVPMMPNVPILTPIAMTTISPMPGMTPMMGTGLSVPVIPNINTPALPNGPIAILQPTPIPLTSSKKHCNVHMLVKSECHKLWQLTDFWYCQNQHIKDFHLNEHCIANHLHYCSKAAVFLRISYFIQHRHIELNMTVKEFIMLQNISILN